mgnify:CR=1 FL=1|nr:MAG TPA: hypothetical protein [Caudoviricetes sp.]
MKRIEFEFNGRIYFLAFTAEALFTVYDHFGYTTDILTTTGCLEPTAEGYKNLCWLAALMAAQGELQRRRIGYSDQEMLEAEDLRVNLPPTKAAALQEAVMAALQEGFRRETEPDEAREVNLVLQEREEAEKKKQATQDAADTLLQQLTSVITRLLTPSSSPQDSGQISNNS